MEMYMVINVWKTSMKILGFEHDKWRLSPTTWKNGARLAGASARSNNG